MSNQFTKKWGYIKYTPIEFDYEFLFVKTHMETELTKLYLDYFLGLRKENIESKTVSFRFLEASSLPIYNSLFSWDLRKIFDFYYCTTDKNLNIKKFCKYSNVFPENLVKIDDLIPTMEILEYDQEFIYDNKEESTIIKEVLFQYLNEYKIEKGI